MNDIKNNDESFSGVKIIKPKAVRLCPSRKIKKSPSSSSTSSTNSDKSQNKFNPNESKSLISNLENISIEEINKDFFKYGENLEEELCQNELLDIMNNDFDSDFENMPKIKRCKNPNEKNIEIMKDSYYNNLLNEINDLFLSSNPVE